MTKGLKVFFLLTALVVVAYFTAVGLIYRFNVVSVDQSVIFAGTYLALILLSAWLVSSGNKGLL